MNKNTDEHSTLLQTERIYERCKEESRSVQKNEEEGRGGRTYVELSNLEHCDISRIEGWTFQNQAPHQPAHIS